MKKAASCLLILIILISSFCISAADAADYSSYDFRTTANDIVKWKKNKEATGNCLFTGDFMQNIVDSGGGEWYACYMGRFGFEDYPQNFLDAITTYVVNKYNKYGTLSETYATDYHKIALAVISAGGNPYDVGGINLIADGVYNRENTASLGRQGMNGWVWGLIALDSLNTQIPDGSCYTREEIITEILKYQLKDGGFSVLATGSKSDVDITAMALYALAPYQNSSTSFTYVPKYERKGRTVTKTAGQVINEAVSFLSGEQLSDGGYSSYGVSNSESISQVIIALCSLGIDPQSDSRFIKDRSLLEAFMSFKCSDGGFAHEKGNSSDPLASEQALGAVSALDRFYSGGSRLFDFTDGVTMQTYTPTSNKEQPTIPVSSNSDTGSSSSAHNHNASSVNSISEHSVNTVVTASNSSSSSHTSSVGGTSGASIKATEKPTDNSTSATAANNSSQADSGDTISANNSNRNTPESAQITQNGAENGSWITIIIIIASIVAVIAVVVIYCVYRKKKEITNQNNDNESSESMGDDPTTSGDSENNGIQNGTDVADGTDTENSITADDNGIELE